jgi:hypothetical protein
MVVGRIVGNGGDIAHGAMSEALWLNVVGCVRIESWVRINRVCQEFCPADPQLMIHEQDENNHFRLNVRRGGMLTPS